MHRNGRRRCIGQLPRREFEENDPKGVDVNLLRNASGEKPKKHVQASDMTTIYHYLTQLLAQTAMSIQLFQPFLIAVSSQRASREAKNSNIILAPDGRVSLCLILFSHCH